MHAEREQIVLYVEGTPPFTKDYCVKFAIPLFLYIDSPSLEHAKADKQVVQQLLKNGMVAIMLSQNGLKHEDIFVGDPKPVPPVQTAGRR